MSNQCQQLACSQNTLKKYVDKKTLIFKEMNSNGSGEKNGQKQNYFTQQSILLSLPAYISDIEQRI